MVATVASTPSNSTVDPSFVGSSGSYISEIVCSSIGDESCTLIAGFAASGKPVT